MLQRVRADRRPLARRRAGRACRGSGWRARACRCRAAGRRARRRCPRRGRAARRRAATSAATRCECPPVDGDFASMTSANACATRADARLVGRDRGGRRGVRARPPPRARSRRAGASSSRHERRRASGSNQRPLRLRAVRARRRSPWSAPGRRCARAAGSPAAAAERVPVAVPVLVERADRRPRSRAGSRGCPRSRAALAAHADELAVQALAAGRAPAACWSRSRTGRSSRPVASAWRKRPVARVEVAPACGRAWPVVVGDEQGGDPRRVARAADVLEQQRVVEVGEVASSRPARSPMPMPIRQRAARGRSARPRVRSSAYDRAPSRSPSSNGAPQPALGTTQPAIATKCTTRPRSRACGTPRGSRRCAATGSAAASRRPRRRASRARRPPRAARTARRRRRCASCGSASDGHPADARGR